MADLNGKNLMFLSGPQANVETLRTSGGAKEGAFYLTNDTNRLYVGKTVDEKIIPVPVNEGVITVADVAHLPTGTAALTGSFYYATAETVLCVYNGKEWVQINPDTKVDSFSTTVSKNTSNTKKVNVVQTIKDNNKTDFDTSFTLVEGSGISFAISGTEITINSSGAGSVTLELTTVQDGKNTKINQKTTIVGADGNTKEDTDTVTIAAGTNIDTVTAGTKTVTINAKTQEVTDGSFANAAVGFTATLEQTSGTDVTLQGLDPIVKVGTNIDTDFSTVEETETVSEHYKNGTATLPIFTAKQTSDLIDKRIKSELATADAMTFKGTAGGATALPAITECSNGDTYKVAGTLSDTDLAKITDKNGTVKVGDLIIAKGTEDTTTGKLTSTATFIHVPSGNEYEVKGVKDTHGFHVTDGAESPTTLGGIALTAGKQIALDDTDTSDAEIRTVEVSHGTINTTKTTGTNHAYGTKADKKVTKKVPVLESLTVDNGHITGYTLTEEEFQDTQAGLDNVTLEAATNTASTDVSIKTNITDELDNTVTAEHNFKSDTLALSVSDAGTTKNTKATLTMNLVWGSF